MEDAVRLQGQEGGEQMEYFPGASHPEFFKNMKNKKAKHTYPHKYPLQIEQTRSQQAISFLLNGKSKINGNSCLCEVDLICSKSFNFKVLRLG